MAMKPWRLPPGTVSRLQRHAPWSLLWAVVRTEEPEEFSPSVWSQTLALGVDSGFPEGIANQAWRLVNEEVGEYGAPFDTEWPSMPNASAWALVSDVLWEESQAEPEALRQLCEARVLETTLPPPPWGEEGL